MMPSGGGTVDGSFRPGFRKSNARGAENTAKRDENSMEVPKAQLLKG